MLVKELIDKLQTAEQDHPVRIYRPHTDEFVDVADIWEGTTFVALEGVDEYI